MRSPTCPDFKLMFPVQANAVFLAAVRGQLQALRQRGWRFYTFIGGGARFMFAWDADPARVDALARDIRAVSTARLKVGQSRRGVYQDSRNISDSGKQ